MNLSFPSKVEQLHDLSRSLYLHHPIQLKILWSFKRWSEIITKIYEFLQIFTIQMKSCIFLYIKICSQSQFHVAVKIFIHIHLETATWRKVPTNCSLGEKGPLAEKGQQMNKNIDIFYKKLQWVIEMYENRRKNYIIHLKHLISLNIGKAYLVQ